jgi:hypothetical protein
MFSNKKMKGIFLPFYWNFSCELKRCQQTR